MGYNIFFGVGAESTWGTPVARTEFHRPYDATAPKSERPRQAFTHLGNRDPDAMFDQVIMGRFPFAIPLIYDGIGRVMEHCFGKLTTTGAGPYTHTLDVDEKPFTRTSPAALKGLTLEAHADLPDSSNESWIGEGGRIASWGIAARQNEEVKLTGEAICEDIVQGAKTGAPTLPDYSALAVLPSEMSIDIDGSTENLYAVSFEVDNGLRDDRAYLGQTRIAPPLPRGKRTISGSFEKEWEDKTIYDKFVSGAAATLLITCTKGSDTITFRMNNIIYQGETPGLSEGEDIDMTTPFVALDDATYGALQGIFTNGSATLYGGD